MDKCDKFLGSNSQPVFHFTFLYRELAVGMPRLYIMYLHYYSKYKFLSIHLNFLHLYSKVFLQVYNSSKNVL